MNNHKCIFTILSVLMALPVCASSLLEPVSFPKTFSDVPFNDRWAVIAEGYTKFDRVYDQDGNCISGCPYPGITITQDKQDVEEATDYFASVIDDVMDQEEQEVTTSDTFGAQNISGSNIRHPSRSSIPLRSPVQNDKIEISSDFCFRTSQNVQGFHGGVDIPIPIGTNVVATADGVVDVAGYTEYNGPYVRIKHSNGFYSWYLHLSEIKVSNGQRVTVGQVIGKSGSEGKRSTGAHLDYRISLKKGDKDMWVDVLCPCKATNKDAKSGYASSVDTKNNENVDEYNKNTAGYACRHSAFWRDRYYSFLGNAKSTSWRIASGHCMTKVSDKLPDEK